MTFIHLPPAPLVVDSSRKLVAEAGQVTLIPSGPTLAMLRAGGAAMVMTASVELVMVNPSESVPRTVTVAWTEPAVDAYDPA